jgi:hypothetical protein
MSIENLINNMRVEREVDTYFENIGEFVEESFELEDQEVIFQAINTVLESDQVEDKITVIDSIIEEAAAKSCQEGKWTRPKQISFSAREPNKVTWGKGVNSWFSTWENYIGENYEEESHDQIIDEINEALSSEDHSDAEKIDYINSYLEGKGETQPSEIQPSEKQPSKKKVPMFKHKAVNEKNKEC